MIQSKTATGVEVTLEGVEVNGCPTVRATFIHPSVGSIVAEGNHFGSPPKEKAVGLIATAWVKEKKTNVCVTIPRVDFDAAMEEAKGLKAARIAAIKSGAVKIRAHYHDGEYLSGYSVTGEARELLEELGLGKGVSGWGLDAKVVKALGEEFTYAQAEALARPAIEKAAALKTARIAAETAKRETAIATAKATGKPVTISSNLVGDGKEGHIFEVTEALPSGEIRRYEYEA